MKTSKKPVTGARRSAARLVVADNAGHRLATAPLDQLAPVRFHIGRILVPVDFSEHSRKALHYAVSFAEQFGAQVTLLHVVEPIVLPADFGYAPVIPVELDDQRVETAARRLQNDSKALQAKVPVNSLVRLGRAWKEVVDTAKAQGTELLIITTHGYTGLKHALMGSVAEKIIRHAPCPVLVVRPDEKDFV